MAHLTVVTGLPGSGKSTLLRAMRDRYVDGVWTTDYQANAINDSPAVTASRHYPTLVDALRQGRASLIADVCFTDTWKRFELEQVLARDVAGLAVDWVFFANDLDQCLANIRDRGRPSRPREEQLARELSHSYIVPVGHAVRAVWRPGAVAAPTDL